MNINCRSNDCLGDLIWLIKFVHYNLSFLSLSVYSVFSVVS